MESHKDASERVRPILQAMERSIDAARRRRTQGAEPDRTETQPPAPHEERPPARELGVPQPNHQHHQQRQQSQQQGDEPANPPRLKARPKRTLLTDFDQNDVRSRAS